MDLFDYKYSKNINIVKCYYIIRLFLAVKMVVANC